MYQSILRKSTMQIERKKNPQHKTIKLHLDTNQPWLRRAGIGTRAAALLRKIYVTSQLPASFCGEAMGIKWSITAIRSSTSDPLSDAVKPFFILRKHLERQGPSFSKTVGFSKGKSWPWWALNPFCWVLSVHYEIPVGPTVSLHIG